MQADGHHTATYVAARIAGFSFTEAEKIAYAAQYVDDATNAGIVQFTSNDYLYCRIASAHKMIDYDNFVDVENHLAWIPFHFLPGNGGLPDCQAPKGDWVERLICRPDSPIARDMLKRAFLDRSHPRGLHRLGIAMHVYADTFAHQGFVGSQSPANQVNDLTSGDVALDKRIHENSKKDLLQVAKGNVKAFFRVIKRVITLMWREKQWPVDFVANFLNKSPVGHAAADVFPDQPYLTWQYTNFRGQTIARDNTATFMQAMDMMVRALRAWQSNDSTMQLEQHAGIDNTNRAVIERLFREQTALDGEERRQGWLKAIEDGEFGFDTQIPKYIGKGAGSWKEQALGTLAETDMPLERFAYKATFLESDWKLFHDALQVHRSDVVHNILPRYGICAA